VGYNKFKLSSFEDEMDKKMNGCEKEEKMGKKKNEEKYKEVGKNKEKKAGKEGKEYSRTKKRGYYLHTILNLASPRKKMETERLFVCLYVCNLFSIPTNS
jgi:hypothetical protein